MKTILIALMLVAGFAQANQGQENAGVGFSTYNPEKIYKALKVKAVAENAGIAGSSTLIKSVGGLSCAKETIIVPNAVPGYSCKIDQDQVNFESIYKALRTKVVNLNTGIAEFGHTQKSVGGLTCDASTSLAPQAKTSYVCKISEN